MTAQLDDPNGASEVRGLRFFVAALVVTVLVLATLLVPLPDLTQRVIVGVLLAAMAVLVVVAILRLRPWEEFRPRVLRWGAMTAVFWGLCTAVDFLFVNQEAHRSLVSATIAAAIYGLIMWFVSWRPSDDHVQA